jgi:hypothetical protein
MPPGALPPEKPSHYRRRLSLKSRARQQAPLAMLLIDRRRRTPDRRTRPEADKITTAARAAMPPRAHRQQQFLPITQMLRFVRPGREIEPQAARALGVFPHRPKPDIRPEPLIAPQAAKRITAERHFAQFAHALPPRESNGGVAAIRADQRGVRQAVHTAGVLCSRR